jgi:MerR family transcriptional regulator, thiopeptide resistance regulator
MEDRQNVIPVLVYEDIETAQEFLVRAFGFEVGSLARDPSGQVVHGEVSAGGTALWLHRVTAEHALASPRSLPATSGELVVLVDDVDAHYRRAVEEGAAIHHPPADMPYGQREYSARDPEGTHWCFATPLV